MKDRKININSEKEKYDPEKDEGLAVKGIDPQSPPSDNRPRLSYEYCATELTEFANKLEKEAILSK